MFPKIHYPKIHSLNSMTFEGESKLLVGVYFLRRTQLYLEGNSFLEGNVFLEARTSNFKVECTFGGERISEGGRFSGGERIV